jgi:hypothetical protein
MMSLFSIVLFIHVLSSMALFAAFALEGNVFLRIRSARSGDQLHASLVSFERLRWIAIPAFVGLLAGGGYLAIQSASELTWVRTSLIATLLIMVVGGIVMGIRMARLKKLVATSRDARDFETASAGALSKALVWSYGFRVGLTGGIVFLMTVHPHLPDCPHGGGRQDRLSGVTGAPPGPYTAFGPKDGSAELGSPVSVCGLAGRIVSDLIGDCAIIRSWNSVFRHPDQLRSNSSISLDAAVLWATGPSRTSVRISMSRWACLPIPAPRATRSSIDHAQAAETHELRVLIIRKGECAVGVKPAMVGMASPRTSPRLNHFGNPLLSAGIRTTAPNSPNSLRGT